MYIHKMEVTESGISVVTLNMYRKKYPPTKTEMLQLRCQLGLWFHLRFDWEQLASLTSLLAALDFHELLD